MRLRKDLFELKGNRSRTEKYVVYRTMPSLPAVQREFSDLFPSCPLPGLNVVRQKRSARRVYRLRLGTPRTTRSGRSSFIVRGGGGEERVRTRITPFRSAFIDNGGVMRCVGSSSLPSLLSSWPPPTHAITVAAPASTFEKPAISVRVSSLFGRF